MGDSSIRISIDVVGSTASILPIGKRTQATMTQSEPDLSHPQTKSEPAQALVLRGPARPDLIKNELLSEIFSASVTAHADSLCLISGERQLTYAQVDQTALALARGLIRHGIGPGHVVGLWMPRGADLLIAQIAIAKTGAAWLPFDADAPPERIAECLTDCKAQALITDEGFAKRAAGRMPCDILMEDDLIDSSDNFKVDARAAGATPDHPAYMIYTSGSTGKPKGIVITGRNICHYLRSANEVYGLTQTDIVFQGASLAFDLSMEEIWIPYMVGACLYVASPDLMGDVDRLPDVMEAAGITVLDTVPTLLSMLTRDIASLRIIILGGEACPPIIANRWCKSGRHIFNSYGPTEATVVATIAEVQPDQPVTIGTPIPNYTCYVVDENLQLLGPGVEGELLIGGPGIAKGYLRRPDLTDEKFIFNPFAPNGPDPRLYRSGDAVVIDANGALLFKGRIDDQVKIRGFRVELGEIENRLSALPTITQACVVLRQDQGLDQLVAFLVTENKSAINARNLRAALMEKLPAYMVPARYEWIEALPRLSSGKANRGVLKTLPLSVQDSSSQEQEDPRNDIEAILLAAARRVLPPQIIPFDADFFTDLGGHSLLAARFVSIVRETPSLAGITLQDVYAARSLRAMADLLAKHQFNHSAPQDLTFDPPSLKRRFLCGLAQFIALPFILALMTAQWLGVFVSYMLLTDEQASLLQEVAALLGVYICINIATIAIAIAAKWLFLGRTKPGRYPLWGVYYYRWWLVQRFLALTHMKWFQGSPLMRLYLTALGAKIGPDALIGDIELGAPDLITIGAYASVGSRLKIANARVEGNELIIGTCEIGEDAYIGTSCVIEEDVIIGKGAELKDLTSIQSGTRIQAYAIWDGSPGKPVGAINPDELDTQSTASATRKSFMTFLYTIMVLAIPPFSLLPLFPSFWVFDRVDDIIGIADIDRTLYLLTIPLMAWPTSFMMVIITVGLIAVFRWTILPRVKEGTYSVHSWFYFRKWTVALSTEIMLEVLSSLFATVYMRAWYRLMGAKIGKDAEISTNLAGRYDLVEIGEKCFIADEVVLGDEDIRRGWMYLKSVRTGARVFIGNDGVVPPGADIPTGALIGIKSKPPANELMAPGDTWFGSPPIKLPVRQRYDTGSNWTYEPPAWKKFARAVFEAVHISLPTMLFITFGTWAVEFLAPPLLGHRYFQLTVIFIICSVLISLALVAVCIIVKWLTMGRYEPMVRPMWSWWAMRTEAVAVMYWGMGAKVLLDHLKGTPFLPWILSLFGTKFGQGCYVDMTDITEFDCVSVGNFVSLNALSALQTHLYEDRVMKIGRVHVEDGVTLGAGSTVLYDTKIGKYARLGPLTVVMKGEEIPAHSQWVGAPAVPKRNSQSA